MKFKTILKQEFERATICLIGLFFIVVGVFLAFHPLQLITGPDLPTQAIFMTNSLSYGIVLMMMEVSGFYWLFIYFHSFTQPFLFNKRQSNWNAKEEVKKWMEKK